MAGKDEIQPRLIAARPAGAAASAGFKPRTRWRLLAGILSAAVLLFGLHLVRERRKIDALRTQLLEVRRTVLAEPMQRYAETRRGLEDLILDAARRPEERVVDPRLRLSGLHAGKGLYLRVPADAATTRESLVRAARTAEADNIPACLGIAPAAARGIWDKADFLSPEWAERVRKQDSLLTLRVTDTVLARQIKVDLPNVLELLRSDWLLLVLDHSTPAQEGVVDAQLWDLRSRQLLLRSRVVGEGALVAARIRSQATTPSAKAPGPVPLATDVARDCSIAAQLRALAEPPPQ